MALDDFKTEHAEPADKYREYPDHKYNSMLESLVDDLQDRFPEEIQVDFIECSPNMEKHSGLAYYKKVDGEFVRYIRVSESYIDKYGTREAIMTIVHEMTHIYFHQKDYGNITERDPRFTWVLGRVGADISDISIYDPCWQDCIAPFLE